MSTLEKTIELLRELPENKLYAVYMFALFVKQYPDTINYDSFKNTENEVAMNEV